MAEDAKNGGLSLVDELRADQGKPTQCGLCRWLQQLTEAERAEWQGALDDRSFTHASIHRAIARRNGNVTRGSVENHRTSGHRA